MSDAEAPDDLTAFVRENHELITRLLAHGDAEARGYALAVLANGAAAEDIDAVQVELDRLKKEENR